MEIRPSDVALRMAHSAPSSATLAAMLPRLDASVTADYRWPEVKNYFQSRLDAVDGQRLKGASVTVNSAVAYLCDDVAVLSSLAREEMEPHALRHLLQDERIDVFALLKANLKGDTDLEADLAGRVRAVPVTPALVQAVLDNGAQDAVRQVSLAADLNAPEAILLMEASGSQVANRPDLPVILGRNAGEPPRIEVLKESLQYLLDTSSPDARYYERDGLKSVRALRELFENGDWSIYGGVSLDIVKMIDGWKEATFTCERRSDLSSDTCSYLASRYRKRLAGILTDHATAYAGLDAEAYAETSYDVRQAVRGVVNSLLALSGKPACPRDVYGDLPVASETVHLLGRFLADDPAAWEVAYELITGGTTGTLVQIAQAASDILR